ncbi:META domain-containing protein [Nonlabens antarcticus]|uniref:META domain-containing protein n=1 Tax=Nonlabens antarcticus TaxID=392714 RepID=UPI0018910880|nr:META domain-containing protein [Nonlabens antarcticus]
MKAQILIFSLMVLTITSCKELEDIQGSYNVTTVDGEDLSDNGITIKIEMSKTENRISGNNGCNQYSGTFTNPEGSMVDLGPMMGTKMYCEETAKIETKYMSQLSLVKRVELKNDVLRLMDEDGNVLIKAKKTNE